MMSSTIAHQGAQHKTLTQVIRNAIPNSGTRRYDIRASVCIILVYAGYVALVEQWLSPWLFMPLAFVCFIRYFVAYHMHFHAERARGPRAENCTYVPVVVGPLQLGYHEYRRNHFLHHRYEGDAKDPDLFLTKPKSAFAGALHCFFEPEQALPRYVHRHGWNLSFALRTFLYFSLFVGMAWYGGSHFWFYVAATRAGSFFSWYVFAWYLHRSERFRVHQSNPIPRSVAAIYAVAFGKDCLIGTLNHFTHHQFGFLPDEELDRAVALIRAQASADIVTK